MREKYIELVKEYINKRPDYKDTLEEIKFNVMSVGATQEEFEEALKQLGIAEAVTRSLSGGQTEEPPVREKKSFPIPTKALSLNYLVGIDIATHIIIIVFIFIGISFVFLNPLIRSAQTGTSANAINPTSHSTPASVHELFATQIYANTTIVDAEKVFSYKPKRTITLRSGGAPSKEIFGFFPYWMIGKQDQVNIDMLTHINLFGLETNGDGNIITVQSDGTPDPGWTMWNDPKVINLILRAHRKRIKVSLTIKAFNRTNIEALVNNDTAQAAFVANAVHLVQSKNLDGINLDFELLGEAPQKSVDGFTRLVQNLSAELKRQNPNATLTVATFITSAATQGFFDVEKLADITDGLIIMGYDIHTPKGPPGPVAPMDGIGLTISSLMQSYIDLVPAEKLILAVPYYGYAWDVSGNGNNAVLPYAEIVENSAISTIYWDDKSKTPWYRYVDPATQVTREVHFENTRSLGIKYDYINEKNLQGVGIWALGYEGRNQDLSQLLVDKFAR